MPRWVFEPGHTAAEFSVRHMMVTYVRGHFKDIHGTLDFDPADPSTLSFEAEIDARKLWTGEPERDEHLRSDHFLDVARHPSITFRSLKVQRVAGMEYKVTGDLTIRGITRPLTLQVEHFGVWRTPFGDTRAGFRARTIIDRHAFDVNWNVEMENGGVVVGHDVLVTIDAEAILQPE